MLRTLGGLRLEGTSFSKRKPLILAAFLALEGPKSRRYLQELFWPRAEDPQNSLSVALSQLKRAGVGVAGGEVLEARVACDALLLKEALGRGQLEEARALYRGRFLEGADEDLSEELEEWVWSTREALAQALYEAHRKETEKRFALGLKEEGEALLRKVLALPGVAEVAEEEPERRPLPEEVRLAFYGLAFLGPVRAGEVLRVSADSLEILWRRGLLTPTGEPTFLPPPTLEARRVALELARRLPLSEAAPYYRLSLPLWQEGDASRGKRALLDLARREVEENPREALALLQDLAPDPEVLLLRARALERLGRYAEALALLEEVPEDPRKSALKGVLCFRMGEKTRAREEAEKALQGDPYSQGEGWNLLGLLLLGEGRFQEAAEAFSRAAVRFLLSGERVRHLGALGNRAVALAELGQGEEAFQEVLEATEGHPLLQARFLLNLGVVKERQGLSQEAEGLYQRALALAEGVGNLEAVGRAWNNLGALYHRQRRKEEAQAAYEKALELARQAGERLLLAAALANWAELRGDRAALEEAIRVLEEAGHQALAQRYRARLGEA
ncbi:tetratricopeptide repeat protein [Thermus sediminis]|uniref:tetratricopeptide repeat protein n=1 Tax=Thermus sediminis TaxID=1761908 RepID=UPI000E3BEF80|nr:tetratricopeptide repeat protein [Thermus sediminis]